jgi:hypothetical protein
MMRNPQTKAGGFVRTSHSGIAGVIHFLASGEIYPGKSGQIRPYK